MGGNLNLFLLIIALNVYYTSADFTCPGRGRFANPDDDNCRSYYLCSQRRNGSYIASIYTCPRISLFDPDISECSISYVCQKSTSSVKYSTEVPETYCKSEGRFPDKTDVYCTHYYLCTRLRNGTFIKTFYNCPNSRFDPNSRICSDNYVCPHTQTTINTISTTTTTELVTVYYDFECINAGRYADMNDRQCQWYWLCSELRNRTFIQNPYKCPGNSIFDSDCHMCSTLIECPTKYL